MKTILVKSCCKTCPFFRVKPSDDNIRLQSADLICKFPNEEPFIKYEFFYSSLVSQLPKGHKKVNPDKELIRKDCPLIRYGGLTVKMENLMKC